MPVGFARGDAWRPGARQAHGTWSAQATCSAPGLRAADHAKPHHAKPHHAKPHHAKPHHAKY
jgi:hypothetical protein